MRKKHNLMESCPCRSGILSSSYNHDPDSIIASRLTKEKNRADTKKEKQRVDQQITFQLSSNTKGTKPQRDIKFWSTDEQLTNYRRAFGLYAITLQFDWFSIFCMSTALR